MPFSTGFTVGALESQNIMGEFGGPLIHPEKQFSHSIIYP